MNFIATWIVKIGIAKPKIILSPQNEKKTKLKPWCCYIGSQPQSLQIFFKYKPINKIKSGQDKIRFDKIKSR